MAKEQKVLGADIKAADNQKEENIVDEGAHKITAESGEELLEKLMEGSKKRSDTRKKKKIEEYKAVRATKDKLFSRLGQTIDVPIIVSDDEVMVFQVKRLSEAENSEIIDRSLAIKNVEDMTEEELEDYNYRLLEKVVVDPKLTQEEWRLNVDTAMVQRIVQKVMQVLTNIDDSRIFDEFQK